MSIGRFARGLTVLALAAATYVVSASASVPAQASGSTSCFPPPSHVARNVVSFAIPGCGPHVFDDVWFSMVIPAQDATVNNLGQPLRNGDQPMGYAAAIACADGNVWMVPLAVDLGLPGDHLPYLNIGVQSHNLQNSAGLWFRHEPENMRCDFSLQVPALRSANLHLELHDPSPYVNAYDWRPQPSGSGFEMLIHGSDLG